MYKLPALFIIQFLVSHYSFCQAVGIPLKLSNNLGSSQILTIGIDPSATNGIDPALGEYALPPYPPSSIFDARLKLPFPSQDYSLKDIRPGTSAPFTSTINYEIEYQPGDGSSVKLHWNFPKGVSAKLSDKFGGIVVNESLKDTGSFAITNIAINKLDLIVYYNLVTSVNSVSSNPNVFLLFQNYPNPFNPTTKIKFYLPRDGRTKLTVYNSIGGKIEELIDNVLQSGHYEINWDGSKFTSGVYLIQLVWNNIRSVKKISLIK